MFPGSPGSSWSARNAPALRASNEHFSEYRSRHRSTSPLRTSRDLAGRAATAPADTAQKATDRAAICISIDKHKRVISSPPKARERCGCCILTSAMKYWAICILALMATPVFCADGPLPEGKGKDVVVNACSSCHSVDRIAALRLSEEGWRNTLRQMIENGASLNPEDINPIIGYLVANFGAPAAGAAGDTAAAPPASIPAVPVPADKAAAVASVSSGDPSRVSFNRDIRPIMSGTCFRCHGPDASSRMAGMRLDVREEALKPKAHGTPIIPGDPVNSEVVQRIFATDGRTMPPPSAHKELTAEQKDTIRRWIAEGAKYEGHWAYQPVIRPSVPAVGGAKVLNPIDAFIQSKLAKEGLKPSEEANRRILIRRVTLDLTGLAPEPAQVDAFLRDRSPDAFEKVVDRLLDSQAYAEHEAVGWLDAVRYADTAGYHSDGDRPAWPYRDYVLKAFRDNKPFDQFTREQLGGDLMPNATTEQKIASAYNRMGRTSAEGGLQPKEYFAKYGADRVRALGANWLGTTLGCAECHDHKFDPVLTKDFYALKAFFADVKEDGLVQDVGPDRETDYRRQWTNRGRNRRVVGVARWQSRWSWNGRGERA